MFDDIAAAAVHEMLFLAGKDERALAASVTTGVSSQPGVFVALWPVARLRQWGIVN